MLCWAFTVIDGNKYLTYKYIFFYNFIFIAMDSMICYKRAFYQLEFYMFISIALNFLINLFQDMWFKYQPGDIPS